MVRHHQSVMRVPWTDAIVPAQIDWRAAFGRPEDTVIR
jgi:hypothetical protein